MGPVKLGGRLLMENGEFRQKIFGYNKDDVHQYIESLIDDNRRIAKAKDESIQELQKKVLEMEATAQRLKTVEEKLLLVQQDLNNALNDLEEKSIKVELLSLKIQELETQRMEKEQNEKKGILISPEFVDEIELLRGELDQEKKQKEAIRIERENLRMHIKSFQEKEARLKELETKLKDYNENETTLRDKEALIESERALIGNAILRAQEKAAEMDKELMIQYEVESKKLQQYKRQIEDFRMKTEEVLTLFSDELGLLSNKAFLKTPTESEADSCDLKGESVPFQLIRKG